MTSTVTSVTSSANSDRHVTNAKRMVGFSCTSSMKNSAISVVWMTATPNPVRNVKLPMCAKRMIRLKAPRTRITHHATNSVSPETSAGLPGALIGPPPPA